MIEYVVGFLFAPQQPEGGPRAVALILKARPEWQRGRLNGIGGKVEANETPYEAMRREFAEETGYAGPIFWQRYASLSDRRGYIVHFFRATAPGLVLVSLKGNADEPVIVVTTHDGLLLPQQVLPNLRWLVPLALDADVGLAQINEAEL